MQPDSEVELLSLGLEVLFRNIHEVLSNARGEERSGECVRAKPREFHSSCD